MTYSPGGFACTHYLNKKGLLCMTPFSTCARKTTLKKPNLVVYRKTAGKIEIDKVLLTGVVYNATSNCRLFVKSITWSLLNVFSSNTTINLFHHWNQCRTKLDFIPKGTDLVKLKYTIPFWPKHSTKNQQFRNSIC